MILNGLIDVYKDFSMCGLRVWKINVLGVEWEHDEN